MQIVIDIPDETYKNVKMYGTYLNPRDKNNLEEALKNSKPLPKGHGDLIDRSELLKHYDNTTYHNGIEERKIHFVQIGYVNDAPTIVEADMRGEKQMDNNIKANVEIKESEEVTEQVSILADAYDSFPPLVMFKDCRNCTINIYPGQTKIVEVDNE